MTASRSTEHPRTRDDFWIPLLVAVHVAVAVTIILVGTSQLYGGEGIRRYHQVAQQPGIPYRDFAVEYAPLDVLVVKATATGNLTDAYRRVVALALVADIGCATLVFQGWGRRVATYFLAVMTPLLPLAYLGLDLIWVGVSMGAFFFIRRGRPRAGGALLAVATLARVWPASMAPALLIKGRWASARIFLAISSVGVLTWFAIGATGPQQVVTFRGATGWEIESTVGSLYWTLSGHVPQLQQGAPRLGVIMPWERFMLALLLLGTLFLVWRRSRHWGGDPAGVPALVCVATLLVVSPIFGLGYSLWLTPWLAIAWSEQRSRRFAILGTGVVIITGCLAVLYVTVSADAIVKGLLLVRSSLSIAIVATWFWATQANEATPDIALRSSAQVSAPEDVA